MKDRFVWWLVDVLIIAMIAFSARIYCEDCVHKMQTNVAEFCSQIEERLDGKTDRFSKKVVEEVVSHVQESESEMMNLKDVVDDLVKHQKDIDTLRFTVADLATKSERCRCRACNPVTTIKKGK